MAGKSRHQIALEKRIEGAVGDVEAAQANYAAKVQVLAALREAMDYASAEESPSGADGGGQPFPVEETT